MTAKDSADGVLGEIAAGGGTEAHNIANFLLDGSGLTRAGADLQGHGNLGSGHVCFHVVERISVPISTGRPAHAGGASKQRRQVPKKEADKIKKKAAISPILERKNAPRLPNERYQMLQLHAGPVRSSSAVASPMTSSTVVAAT